MNVKCKKQSPIENSSQNFKQNYIEALQPNISQERLKKFKIHEEHLSYIGEGLDMATDTRGQDD